MPPVQAQSVPAPQKKTPWYRTPLGIAGLGAGALGAGYLGDKLLNGGHLTSSLLDRTKPQAPGHVDSSEFSDRSFQQNPDQFPDDTANLKRLGQTHAENQAEFPLSAGDATADPNRYDPMPGGLRVGAGVLGGTQLAGHMGWLGSTVSKFMASSPGLIRGGGALGGAAAWGTGNPDLTQAMSEFYGVSPGKATGLLAGLGAAGGGLAGPFALPVMAAAPAMDSFLHQHNVNLGKEQGWANESNQAFDTMIHAGKNNNTGAIRAVHDFFPSLPNQESMQTQQGGPHVPVSGGKAISPSATVRQLYSNATGGQRWEPQPELSRAAEEAHDAPRLLQSRALPPIPPDANVEERRDGTEGSGPPLNVFGGG